MKALKELKAALNEAKLTNKEREKLQNLLFQASRKFDDSIPFVTQSFAEHAETVIEKAKIEVEAHINNVITRAGLESLVEQGKILSLPGKGEDNG